MAAWLGGQEIKSRPEITSFYWQYIKSEGLLVSPAEYFGTFVHKPCNAAAIVCTLLTDLVLICFHAVMQHLHFKTCGAFIACSLLAINVRVDKQHDPS